jgi:hypothetical protein
MEHVPLMTVPEQEMHAPALQVCLLSQTTPHAPQLFVSVATIAHLPPQTMPCVVVTVSAQHVSHTLGSQRSIGHAQLFDDDVIEHWLPFEPRPASPPPPPVPPLLLAPPVTQVPLEQDRPALQVPFG